MNMFAAAQPDRGFQRLALCRVAKQVRWSKLYQISRKITIPWVYWSLKHNFNYTFANVYFQIPPNPFFNPVVALQPNCLSVFVGSPPLTLYTSFLTPFGSKT